MRVLPVPRRDGARGLRALRGESSPGPDTTAVGHPLPGEAADAGDTAPPAVQRVPGRVPGPEEGAEGDMRPALQSSEGTAADPGVFRVQPSGHLRVELTGWIDIPAELLNKRGWLDCGTDRAALAFFIERHLVEIVAANRGLEPNIGRTTWQDLTRSR